MGSACFLAADGFLGDGFLSGDDGFLFAASWPVLAGRASDVTWPSAATADGGGPQGADNAATSAKVANRLFIMASCC